MVGQRESTRCGRNAENPRGGLRSDCSKATFAAVGLVLLTLCAYWGVWNFEFVDFDDTEYVTQNPHVTGGLTLGNIAWAFAHFHAANWHPLTWISHMADASLFGMWAGGHHITNLVFHMASTLLLFAFFLCAAGRLWPAACVAALFALHPLHVESVAWVAERKDVLSAFFWLVTMCAYAFYVKKPGLRRYITVVVSFGLGLMCKPMLVTLPLVLVLLDYWPLGRITEEDLRCKTGSVLWRLVLEKLPLAFLACCSIVLTLYAQKQAIAPLEMADLSSRLTNALVSYCRYIQMMIWPRNLAVYYPHPRELLWARATLAFAFLAAATTAAVYLGRKHRYLLTGWIWYVITLAPVIGIVQVGNQSHADRYTYIPLIGLFVVFAWSIADLVNRGPWSLRFCAGGAAVLLAALCLATAKQAAYWRDSVSLFSRAVDATENNQVMMMSLGLSLMNRGELDRSLEMLRRAVAVKPDVIMARYNLAMVHVQRKEYAAAAEEFRRIINVTDHENSWINLGNCLLEMQQSAEAERVYRSGIERFPASVDLHFNLAVLLEQTGRTAQALEEARRAAALAPASSEIADLIRQLERKNR